MKKFNDFNKESKDSKDEVESTDSSSSLIENFSKKYGLLNNNVENSNNTVKLFEDMFSKLDQYVKKDEISEFLFSQIVVLKEQFEEFKTNVNSLNNQKTQEITDDVEKVISKANLVIEKIDQESKLYKKKYFEDNLINEEKFKDNEKLKYAVTEILKEFESKLETFLTSDQLDITNKKYNKKIVEVYNDFEKIRKSFVRVDNHFTLSKDQFKDLSDKLNSLTENIFSVEQKIKEDNVKQNYKIVEADTKLDKKIEETINEISNLKDSILSDLVKIENNFTNTISKDLSDTKQIFESKLKDVKSDQVKSDAKLKKAFNEEFKLVTKDIQQTNSKLDKQLNKYKLLEDKTKILVDEVKLVFKDKKLIDIDTKIKFLEETLEKFNDKTVLTENILNVPSDTNKDPLTPLDQNYVTFDQLKKHYQLFINRVQQQLMSIGGGGAVRIDQLDDVSLRNAAGTFNVANGQSLVYITANARFEPRTVSGGSGGGVDSIGGATGDVGNVILGRMVNDSGVLTIANVAGYHANLESELTTANVSATGAADGELYFSNARANLAIAANVQHSLVRSLTLAASDETSDLETGTGKVTFRAPFAMTLPATPLPRISVQTAPAGSTIIVDINESGSTILSTKLSIDAGEKTSTTAATPCVVSDASIADDAEITVDIDQVGSGTAGKGLKLTLYYTVTE